MMTEVVTFVAALVVWAVFTVHVRRLVDAGKMRIDKDADMMARHMLSLADNATQRSQRAPKSTDQAALHGDMRRLRADTVRVLGDTLHVVAGDFDRVLAPISAPPAPQTMPTVAVAPPKSPSKKPVRLIKVEDELGVWQPSEHEQATPLILGDVLAWRKWKTIRPSDVGLVSA